MNIYATEERTFINKAFRKCLLQWNARVYSFATAAMTYVYCLSTLPKQQNVNWCSWSHSST